MLISNTNVTFKYEYCLFLQQTGRHRYTIMSGEFYSEILKEGEFCIIRDAMKNCTV